MAVSVFEVQGREQSRTKVSQPMEQGGVTRRKYRIEESDGDADLTEAAARSALYLQTPNMVDNMFRDTMQVTEIAPGQYEGDVTYAILSIDGGNKKDLRMEPGEYRVRLNAGTITKRVTHGKTRSVGFPPIPTGDVGQNGEVLYSPTETYPGTWDRTRGAVGIEVNGDNYSVEGIDIPIATLEMAITIARNSARLAHTNFWKDIARMTGKLNPAQFMGFEPGEVMFMGGTTEVSSKHFAAAYKQYNDAQVMEVTYEFAMSENLRNFPMSQIYDDAAPPHVIPFKGGWDLVDVRTRPMGNRRWETIIPVIEAVKVVQVHDTSKIDFNDIWRP